MAKWQGVDGIYHSGLAPDGDIYQHLQEHCQAFLKSCIADEKEK